MLIDIGKLGLSPYKGGGVPVRAMFRIRNGVKEYAASPSRGGAVAVRSAA